MSSSSQRLTREERRAQTRRRLLEAAVEVFARRGYHGATVEQIAATAGVTQGALYGNFAGKHALFLALVDQRMAGQVSEVGSALDAEQPEETAAQLRDHTRRQFQRAVDDGFVDALLVLEVVMHAVREDPELRQSLLERYRRADAHMGNLIRSGRQAGQGASTLSPDEIAVVHSALIQGLGIRMLLDPDALTPQEATSLLEQTVRCLTAP